MKRPVDVGAAQAHTNKRTAAADKHGNDEEQKGEAEGDGSDKDGDRSTKVGGDATTLKRYLPWE